MRHVCPECGDVGEPGACPRDGATRVAAGTDGLLGTRVGSWQVARLIGAGGMGRVYLAVQPEIGARVAIKVLKDATDAELVDRFFTEARAVNLIRHEGIVDVIDLGRLPDGAPYIVMEYLDGVPLSALIRRSPRPHAGAMTRVVCDVLAALAAAHAKDIIHRDLKPDNVFVSPRGGVTVLDFGIAKLARTTGTPTHTNSLLGTPAYMSPEQARGQAVGPRSDLYTVGVILYEATTGTLPFVASSVYDLLDQHVREAPRPPREIDPAIPDAIEKVILRALAKDPDERFASAADMRRELESALEQLPRAELELPTIEPVRTVARSDPHGATAATGVATDAALVRSDSLAHAKTHASGEAAVVPDESVGRTTAVPRTLSGSADGGTPAAAREPARELRVSRGLVAVMLVSSLLGLVAVGYVVMRGRRTPVIVATRPPPPLDALVAPPPADAAAPLPEPPRDADVPDAPPPDAKQPRKARPAPVAPPDFSQGPIALTVRNLDKFDPFAFYKTAAAKAEWAAGEPVRPSKITWRNLDRDGHIDITRGGSAEYFFLMKERRADGTCFVLIFIEQDQPRVTLGRVSGEGPCGNALAPPRCSPVALWERALAAGMSPDATLATANKLGRSVAFSAPGEKTQFLVDDCP